MLVLCSLVLSPTYIKFVFNMIRKEETCLRVMANKWTLLFVCFLLCFPSFAGYASIHAAGLPDGVQTFSGYSKQNGVPTSPDGFFTITAHVPGDPGAIVNADDFGAYIYASNSTINGPSNVLSDVYIEIKAASSLGSFKLSSLDYGEFAYDDAYEEYFQNVVVKGYAGNEEVFSTTPYTDPDHTVNPNYPTISPNSARPIDSFRIYFTKPSGVLLDVFNLLSFSIREASPNPPPTAPVAPTVTADDTNNVIIGLNSTMEFKVDNGSYVKYNGNNAPDLSGNHTVYVRVAADNTNDIPPSTDTILTFTQNPPSTYTLSYDGNGSTGGTVPVDGHAYEQGDSASVATNTGGLARTGYTFEGWTTQMNGNGDFYPEGSSFVVGSSNVVLYAKWKINTYTVTFKDWDGRILKTDTVDFGSGTSSPTTPVREGYDFSGWSHSFSNVASNLEIIAQYTIQQHTVSFNTNGGTSLSPVTADYNATISSPSPPTKTGYQLGGWFQDSQLTVPWNFATDRVLSDIVLHAKWIIDTYTVSFDSNGGSMIAAATFEFNDLIDPPTPPTKTGYTFGGWYTDPLFNEGWNFTSDHVTKDTTLYAKWIPNQYTVTFQTNGGSTVSELIGDYNTIIAKPVDPTKLGYTFSGWYVDPSLTINWNFQTDKLTDHLTLYAKWLIIQHTVTFEVHGGNTIDPVQIDDNTSLIRPTPPVKTGYTFKGWYKDSGLLDAWNFDVDKVTDDLTLYAKWEMNQYTVSFQTDGGSAISPLLADYNSTITEPASPTKNGYTFKGWYADNTFHTSWNFETDKITSNTTLYAKWEANQYTISFNSNGGSTVSTVVASYHSLITAPTSPTKAGYNFSGWYKDANFTNAWSFTADKVTGDLTLFARWTLIPAPPAPGPTPSPEPKVEEVDLEVETGNANNGTVVTKIPIRRVTDNAGIVRDEVTFVKEKVSEMINRLVAEGEDTARTFIPDKDDKVSTTTITVPKDAMSELSNGQFNLEIYTQNAGFFIPKSSLLSFTDSLYFRVVPVKDTEQKLAIEDRAKKEELIKEIVGPRTETVQVLGRPMEIETNMQSRTVVLTLPLQESDLPKDPAQRQKVLDNIAIFIEHSDGTKEVIKGQLTMFKNDSMGITFNVTKFSTFTMVYLDGLQTYGNKHRAYIKGYPDHTFRPNAVVTRAQMAAMLMRNAETNAESPSASDYVDVPKSHWGYNEIMLAKSSGTMLGYGNTFRPTEAITRAQMAMIVYRQLKLQCENDENAFPACQSLNETPASSYTDVPKDYWASEAIHAIRAFNIMEGYTNGHFYPTMNLTRAQAVKTLNRLFKRGPLYGEFTPSFHDVSLSHWAYRDIEEAARDHSFLIDKDGNEIISNDQ